MVRELAACLGREGLHEQSAGHRLAGHYDALDSFKSPAGFLLVPGGTLQRNVQQFGCVAAEDGYAVAVAQAGRPKDVIDGGRRPRKRIVCPEHDLAGATHGDQMA
jgi:hypothetical protein